MFDQFGQIAFESQIAAAILGNATTREFVLIDLSGPTPDSLHSLRNRGLDFVGVAGFDVNGVLQAAFAVELDDSAVDAIAEAWIEHLATRILLYLQPPAGDSVQFLKRLYALEDTRVTQRA
jgi:hypothetical protein